MSEHVRFIDWVDRPIRDLAGGVRRRVFSTDKMMVVQYLYEPGAVFPEHEHPQDQITVVQTGAIEFTVGGEVHVLRPGKLLSIPGGVAHSARVIGGEPVDSLNMFHPIKEAFLDEAKDHGQG